MSDSSSRPASAPNPHDPTDAIHRVANICATAASHAGVDSLLEVRDSYFVAWEKMAADWLSRRHQATADTRKLLERLRDSRDIHEFLNAQQDWYSATLQRLMMDCASLAPLTLAIMSKGSTDAAEEVTRPASGQPRREDTLRPPGAAAAALRSTNASALAAARTGRSVADSRVEGELPTHSD